MFIFNFFKISEFSLYLVLLVVTQQWRVLSPDYLNLNLPTIFAKLSHLFYDNFKGIGFKVESITN